MENSKKTACKTQLVRNSMKGNKKVVVIRDTPPIIPLIDLGQSDNEESPCSSESIKPTRSVNFDENQMNESMKNLSLKGSCKSDFNLGDSRNFSSSKFSNPSLYYTHSNIGKKIDKLGKMKTSSLKSVSEKRTLDDKVARQVNFPYEKKIYKDLMPLSSSPSRPEFTLNSREPMPLKDREPMLEEFVEMKDVQEYSYIPNIKLEPRKSRAHCNNLRLYKILQLLEQG